ncbi:MAG: cation:dicarboxylase symporter family transporter [Bacteroidaceae bacterium]|nr:cation:dicarboxylase symporter family transporter [Bacteroidaceae bacterium]
MKQFLSSTIFRLLLAIIIGIILGFLTKALPESLVNIPIQVFLITKQATSQIILFIVPLIIIGCVAPSITSFSGNVTKLLFFTIGIAYISTICAAFLSMAVGYASIPMFNFGEGQTISKLPENLLKLTFPTMDTMSALLLSILIGLGTIWIKSERFKTILEDFKTMVLEIVKNVLVPILPLFIGSNFALLAIEDKLSMLQVYLPAVLIIISIQLVWIVVMYVVATLYSKKNGWKVAKVYPPAYFTAIGTMSSAATLPVSLECISKTDEIEPKTSDFALPLFCNIHLCGSVVAEIFLVLTTYYTFYGTMPDMLSMIIFAVLASVIAIGSPGVPGGINMSCIGLVYSIVLGHEDQSFFAITTAIFAIQDGFGTACNVTTDGALTMMTEKFLKKSAPPQSVNEG